MTQWLIPLVQAHEAKSRRPEAVFDSEADLVVMAELARRLTNRS